MRYLNPSALVAARYIASEAMRRRRPRRAARVRAYAPAGFVPYALTPHDILNAVLDGLHRLEVRAS
ncbi:MULTISPECIES: hypothetical protein [Nocardiopsidaceae]|uniref:Uncharacterized protein n=1 Tax=Streptomonospora nanhaiensis TaxID=1323731 RepID=A0ABY6YLR6_9ACTN|nr:hypothetical protein [Streptomonospora nanhaiensis]WAE73158.1 hypothetical protein OUQ99_29055 [Streptomonospora nanhaiensis]